MSFDNLTSIPSSAAEGAFYNCAALAAVNLPVATAIGNYTFASCSNLAELKIATAAETLVKTIESEAFHNTDTSLITLTIGSANADLVDGNTLTMIDTKTRADEPSSCEFVEIIMVDGDGNIVAQETKLMLADISANSEYVSGNTFTFGDFSCEFKSITLQ